MRHLCTSSTLCSMFNQHATWLEASAPVPWRRPIASLNYLLSSHVWRHDHNGFTHQDPGFLDVVVNKRPEIVRIYLPPDTKALLSTYDHCLRSKNYINVVVAGKQPVLDWLTAEEAALHCARGVDIWNWACNIVNSETPQVVLACAGDIPTLEILEAAAVLRDKLPGLNMSGPHREICQVLSIRGLRAAERRVPLNRVVSAAASRRRRSSRPATAQYAGIPCSNLNPCASGPTSTTSNPNDSMSRAATHFASTSSPAIGNALRSVLPTGRAEESSSLA